MKKYSILFFIGLLIIFFIFIFYKNKDDKSLEKNKIEIKKPKVELKKEVSFLAVGDVLIHSPLYKEARKNGKKKNKDYDFEPFLKEIKSIFLENDLVYYNQESLIGTKKLKISSYPRFNSPEEIGEAMINAGANLVSLANNHSYDKGSLGIKNSLEFWKKQKNVVFDGINSSQKEQDEIKYFEKNGIKFAFLAYTDLLNGLKPKKSFEVNRFEKEKVKKKILEAKKNSDFVLFSIHWGNEHHFKPTKRQKEIANFLAENGVDLVIGSHPHVVEPVEKIKNTWVIYSLGNFLSSQVGESRKVGLGVKLNFIKEGQNKKIEKVKPILFYTYSKNRKNWKLIPFSKITEKELKNHKKVQEKYLKIIR